MNDLRCALREIHGGAVATRLLADILRWAERDGVLERMRRMSRFTETALCDALESDLGYALGMGNRQRMIWLLLRLLGECGWVREAKGTWDWSPEESGRVPGCNDDATAAHECAATEGQYGFFLRCLESVPGYLRGGGSSVLFDPTHAAAWDTFLGCREFRTCRSLLLELMGIERIPRVVSWIYATVLDGVWRRPSPGFRRSGSRPWTSRMPSAIRREPGRRARRPPTKTEGTPLSPSPGWDRIGGAGSGIPSRFPTVRSTRSSSRAGIRIFHAACGGRCIASSADFSRRAEGWES